MKKYLVEFIGTFALVFLWYRGNNC